MSTIQIILIIVIGILLLALGIYKGYGLLVLLGLVTVILGLYKSYQKTTAFNEELNQKLVTPYFTLISEGKTEEAYQKFTTDRYKAQYALADYQANYQRIERERGRLNRWKVFDREETYNVIDGSRLLRVKVDCYFGEKNYFINIVLELTKDAQGNYKVDGFFMKNLIGGYPGPW
jgi:uncharacterized membrane protein